MRGQRRRLSSHAKSLKHLMDCMLMQVFAFTAPYSKKAPKSDKPPPLPDYNADAAFDFQVKHGMGIRAVGTSSSSASSFTSFEGFSQTYAIVFGSFTS